MADAEQGPLLPYTFDCQWNGEKFKYTERAQVPEYADAENIALVTQQKLELAFQEIDFPEQVETLVEVESIKAGTQVQAMMEIRPGRPEGYENLGVRLLCSELMTQVAADDEEAFEDLVKFSKMMSGIEEFDEELVDDITPERPPEE